MLMQLRLGLNFEPNSCRKEAVETDNVSTTFRPPLIICFTVFSNPTLLKASQNSNIANQFGNARRTLKLTRYVTQSKHVTYLGLTADKT